MNPYPGLRPFQTADAEHFFGRDQQIAELRRILIGKRFMAVVGESGSGKSSLVHAGLVPRLTSGAQGSWLAATLRPGRDPMQALVSALHELARRRVDDPVPEERRAIIEATLRRSSLGLAEAATQLGVAEGSRLLLVVDQFEELFTHRNLRLDAAQLHDDSVAFVRLLLDSAEQRKVPVHVVLTMRTEFIGRCTEFAGLANALNQGQYLVPFLGRDQVREAIVAPAQRVGVEVAPRLVQRMLNDAGDQVFALPLLQHALFRVYGQWEAGGDPTQPMDLPHYDQIGGLLHAIDLQAEALFSELTPADQQSCRLAFQTITQSSADDVPVRRPQTVEQILEQTGVTEASLASALRLFRDPACQFLMPLSPEPLAADTAIDVTHESVLRSWPRLGSWLEDERRSSRLYRRLAEDAGRYAAGQVGLRTQPQLYATLAWWRCTGEWAHRRIPTAKWAERYHPEFDRAIRYLELSETEFGRAALQGRVRTVVGVGTVMGTALALVLWQSNARLRQANVLLNTERDSHHDAAHTAAFRMTLDEDPTAAAAMLRDLKHPEAAPGVLQSIADLAQRPVARQVLVAGRYVRRMAVSPDASLIATDAVIGRSAGEDCHDLVLWNGESGARIHDLELNTRRDCQPAADELLFTPDGAHVVALYDGVVLGWNKDQPAASWTTSAASLATSAEGDGLEKLALSPSGAYAVAGGDREVVVLGTADGAGVRRLRLPDSTNLIAVGVGDDGRVAYATETESPDGATTIHALNTWDSATETAGAPPLFGGETIDLRVGPDGLRWIHRDVDSCALLTTVDPASLARSLPERDPSCATADGYMGYIGADFADAVRGGPTPAVVLSFAGAAVFGEPRTLDDGYEAAGGATAAALHAGQRRVAIASKDANVVHVGPVDGRPTHTLRGHSGTVHTMAFSADGTTLVTAARDGTVRVWPIRPRDGALRLDGCLSALDAIPSGTNEYIAGSCDSPGSDPIVSRVYLWDKEGAATEESYVNGTIRRVRANPADPTTASIDTTDGTYIWRSSSASSRSAEAGPTRLDAPGRAIWSHDGRWLATAADTGGVKLWATGEWARPHAERASPAGQPVAGFAFAEDNRSLVVIDQDGVWTVPVDGAPRQVAPMAKREDDDLASATARYYAASLRTAREADAFDGPITGEPLHLTEDGLLWWQYDTSLYLWYLGLPKPRAVRVPAEPPEEVGRVRGEPHGVAVLFYGGTVWLWTTDSESPSVRLPAATAGEEKPHLLTSAEHIGVWTERGDLRSLEATTRGLISSMEQLTNSCLLPEIRVHTLFESIDDAKGRWVTCETAFGRPPHDHDPNEHHEP